MSVMERQLHLFMLVIILSLQDDEHNSDRLSGTCNSNVHVQLKGSFH